MAKPTALAKPWPRGPVVTSIPGVSWASGWPGVMLSTCYTGWNRQCTVFSELSLFFFSSTYPKRLQVIHGDFIPEQMQQSILEHASVTVPKQDKKKGSALKSPLSAEGLGWTYERTKRSRLMKLGFFGLKVMNLLKRTWATGAKPMGAPGWPELALKVASTWCWRQLAVLLSRLELLPPRRRQRRGQTHGKDTDGVDGQLIHVWVAHDCGCSGMF